MELNWIGGHFDTKQGYGRYSLYMIRALQAIGVDVTAGLFDSFAAEEFARGRTTVDCTYLTHFPEVPGQWGLTMWEDTALPPEAAAHINERCQRLLVPCEHNADVFQQNGVTVPVHVVHGGTDPDDFPLITERADRPYTFMCLGDRGARKGWEIVLYAFACAFPNNEDVRLIVKCLPGGMKGFHQDVFADKRISLWEEDVPNVADIYPHADCYVFPSKGEGWGMPPREAAMMGLPVIATRWSGLEVGIDCWAIPINRFHMQKSYMPTYEGMWPICDPDEVTAHMRWCYDHPDAARQRGRDAAAWLRDNQTWQHSARQLMDLVETYA